MAIMLPGWLEEALQFAGYEWPSTNEDTLEAWAQEWSALSTRASGHADEVEHAVAHVAGRNEGPGVESSFTGYMRGNSNLGALRDFATASGMLGQACATGVAIGVTLKWAVIGQLATYRRQPVAHHVDPSTGVNVITMPDGTLISGWKLNPAQLQNLLTHGNL